jgi:hypothetical protein
MSAEPRSRRGPGSRRIVLPDVAGILSAADVAATAETIADLQRPSGMIPWFPGGHSDPWNHVEAAMALDVAGRTEAAEAAYRWLESFQLSDGSWYAYYAFDGAVEDARRDTNVSLYVATGLWHHTLVTGDPALAAELWPMVERAVHFALALQLESGALRWSIEPDGRPATYALLTGSASSYFSLRCAVAAAASLGLERPDWELAAGRLAHAIVHDPDVFADKRRWAMDWYYPVLSGAVTGAHAESHLAEHRSDFILDGRGVRCVSDQEWVTTAETAECAMAYAAAGGTEEARMLLAGAQQLRHDDGSYWTGRTYPGGVNFPGGERSTYSAAAVILAADALCGEGPASGLFLSVGLPDRLDLIDDALFEVGLAEPEGR